MTLKKIRVSDMFQEMKIKRKSKKKKKNHKWIKIYININDNYVCGANGIKNKADRTVGNNQNDS